ncbi:unnamed protein product [Paramecium sonneborni]|uniref:Protein kinase domain-containing protein n=1 Tax=Paramecium sonneborni TaxID=65129 RepID=A0A8S1KVD6_9CILI|nr:unnamed protein product [Paramecium sonneborni]
MEGLLGNFQRIQTFQNQEQQQLFEDKVRKYEQYPKPTNRKEGYQNLSSNSSFLQFSYSHCFSLELLIAAIKTNYIRLFNGQIILILQKIIEHFQLKQSKAIHHGNIQPRNIIIELQVDDQFKTLTTYARPINIKRIYFTNYILNQTESDGDNLKTIIVGFLELAEIRRNDKKLFQEDFLQQILKFPYYQIEETLQTLVIDSKKQYYQDSDQETGYFAPRYWWSKDYPYELEKIKKITESNDNMLDKVIQEETMKKKLEQYNIQFLFKL